MGFAFIFESVGGTEWFVLLGVILIVVGPKNLPSAARKAGQIMANLRRAADEFKRQLLSMDEEVRKTVNDVVSDDSPSTSTAEDHDSHDESTSDYSGEYDESGNPYPDENPYPGHEDEFFDETSYQNDYGSGSSDAESGADEKDPSPDSGEQGSPTPPTDAELRAVKITVSPAPGKRK